MTLKSVIRHVAIVPLFIIPFLPLYSEGSLFFPFIAGKGFAFRILVGIAVGAWLLLALSDKKYRPKWSWTLLIYGALVAWMFIADLFAANPHKAFWSNYERMDGFVTLAHVFLFFVVAGSVLSVGKLFKKWWLTVLGASLFVGIHGVIQLMGLAQIHQGGTRLDANLGNAAYLAAYLLFIIAIALWQAFESKGWLRYGLLALAALHTVLLFSTATRGAILGFVGAVVLGTLVWAYQSGKQGRKIGAAIIGGLLLIIGGFLLIRDTEFVRQDPIFSRIASITVQDGATRFTLWGMAAKGVMERPITGWGHEGFSYIFTKHYEPSLYAQEPWFDRAHNVFIDWLVYGGIPAFVLFVALLLSAIVGLVRAPITKMERVVLISAIAAYAFQAMFVFDNLMSYIMLAAILAVAHIGTARPIAKLEELREIPDATMRTVALPIIAVLTIAVVWVVNAPGIIGGQQLIKALGYRANAATAIVYYEESLKSGTFATQEVREQLISYAGQVAASPGVSNEVKQKVVTLAFSEIQKEITQAPLDARILIMYAQALEGAGDMRAALQVLQEAEKLSPTKQVILIQAGLTLWKLDDRAAADEYFTRAYDLAPAFSEAAAYAAAGDIITGNVAKGKALLVETFGTTTVNHDIVRFAFLEAKLYPELLASTKLMVTERDGSAESRYYLARVYATVGRVNDARAEIQATIVAFPQTKAVGEELLRQIQSAP